MGDGRRVMMVAELDTRVGGGMVGGERRQLGLTGGMPAAVINSQGRGDWRSRLTGMDATALTLSREPVELLVSQHTRTVLQSFFNPFPEINKLSSAFSAKVIFYLA